MRSEREPSQAKDSLKTDKSKRRGGRLSGKEQRLKPTLAPVFICLTELQLDVIEIEAHQPDGGYDVRRSRWDEGTGQRGAVSHHKKGEIAPHITIVQSEDSGSLPQFRVDHQQDGQDWDHQGAQHERSAEDRAQPHLRFGTAGPEENGDD